MPNYINPNAAAQNFYNPYDNSAQYGVNMPQSSGGSGLLSTLASFMPGIGPLVGAGMNMLGQHFQNLRQEDFYESYMSPQARMSQMKAAGINPAAAAQGIAGSAPPQMNAAPPTNAFSGLGEQLGNSVNTALGAKNLMATNEDIYATIKERQANAKNLNAAAELTNSQNVEQKITNDYKRAVMDRVIRDMDTKYNMDTQTLRVLTNDANLADALFTGKITQFWLSTQQMVQDLINAEEEHNLIIANIKARYSDIALNAAYIGTEEAKQANIAKDTELKEEDRRYKAFRRNMISEYHYDPESTTQQNIAFALSIGDISTANYWAHTLARYQAEADGWSEEQKGALSQQFVGYQGLLDMVKFMAGGAAAGGFVSNSAPAPTSTTSDATVEVMNTSRGIEDNIRHSPSTHLRGQHSNIPGTGKNGYWRNSGVGSP